MTKVSLIVKQCGNFSDALDNLSLGHSMGCFLPFIIVHFLTILKRKTIKKKKNRKKKKFFYSNFGLINGLQILLIPIPFHSHFSSSFPFLFLFSSSSSSSSSSFLSYQYYTPDQLIYKDQVSASISCATKSSLPRILIKYISQPFTINLPPPPQITSYIFTSLDSLSS